MYLKSLVLKGFKSFADRSVLSLEPGLTVIVGPNGSGKSNISDAILWALGEQSAKQLRGQTMEDVIFSGSSARNAVGVAEVDIVLDNSDGTLPIDFEEVAFTRRMYRSGESEYLINGSPALLRDILDILHDSGLGRDTHSIISQGSLSSVLRSRPEDRRALIEEAAGVLKHRKRKERAAHKLDAMDVSLDRIRDVSKEIERQLRPLERQAKAAQQYADLSAELKDLEMQLSVDDLRGLQSVWSEADKREKEAEAEVELSRYRYTEKENELAKYQKMLEEQGLFVGDIAEQRRRCQSIIERLDSNMLLLEEKGNNMVARVSDLRSKIHSSTTQLADAKNERDSLSEEMVANSTAIKELSRNLAELGRKSEALRKARKEADDEYSRMSAELRGKERAIDDSKSRIEKSNQAIESMKVEDDMLARRFEQIDEQHSVATNALASRRARFDELQAQSDKVNRDFELARLDIDKRVRLLEQRRSELAKQRDAYNAISAEMQGIKEVDRAFETASPALSWVIAHESEYGDTMKPISDLFRAPEKYQLLVERLLGADIFGLMVDDAESAGLIAERLLSDTKGEGGISFLPVDRARQIERGRAKAGKRLLDELEYPIDQTSVAEALLGDVYIVDSIPEAVAASKSDETGSRFATMDAAVVWPSGKITLGVQTNDVEGVLARRQRLGALEDEMDAATAALADAEMAVSEAENVLNLAQQDGFELAQKQAAFAGELDSLRDEISRLEQSITQVAAEREHIVEQRKNVASRMESSQPLIAESQQRIEALQSEIDSLSEAIAAGSDDRASRATAEAEVREAISKTNVDIATTSTRELYIEQRLGTLGETIAELEHAIAVSYDTQASLDVLSHRVDPLYRTFESLSEGVKEWANKLRDQALFEQSNSSSLVETINGAREAVAQAKSDLDEKNAMLSDVRVDKGKIETQVDAAVNNIVETNGVMLETALETPPLENRNAAEDRAIKLRRRIAGIGLVNQVARQEYEDLKARSEYINSQVADLEEARKALSKIVAAIDRKMRNQFLETFEEVDKNFQEVFESLFPGGTAHLSLTDPDHPEATGVEVHAQPRGKKITKMSLMSGGEMSLTALALLFAVYRTRTVPFYVLDEVDDALDDTNLRRLVACVDSMRHETQFLIITHARRTMEMADVLYGVSMQADGVSKVVSQKLDRSAAGLSDDAAPEELQEAIDSGQVERMLGVAPAKAAGTRVPSAVRGKPRR